MRRLLHRCLERDAARRLRDIGDARLEIDETLSEPATSLSDSGASQRRSAAVSAPVARTSPVIRWAAAAGILVAGAVLALWYADRYEVFWRHPFEGATYTELTDFEGAEQHAAISRKGQFVVFVADRDGSGVWDAWVRQIGTSNFYNLTNGRLAELRNPATRTVGFNFDDSRVVLWSRTTGAGKDGGSVDAGSTVPTMGGPIEPFLKMKEPISELDFSPDGKRMVFHPPTRGDPVFIIAVGDKDTTAGQPIIQGEPGQHNHFLVWSPDEKFIYFVKGPPLEKGDVWRIPSAGGTAERITQHDSAVSFPTLLDDRTLLYLATDQNGDGPWIYAMDLKHRVAHRISRGLERACHSP